MELPDLRIRPQLLASGWTDGELQRLRRTRELATVRRGAYIKAGQEPDEAEARHGLLVRAVLPHLAPGSVISHVSAAVLHGLPVWAIPLARVHVTRAGTGGGRVTRGVHLHVGPLRPDEIVLVDGIAVTSGARTVLDIARTVPFEQAVVVADAALRAETADRASLHAAYESANRWRGGPQALRVVRFADGLADGPGESRSRVAMARAGLPPPVLQYEVRDRNGRFLGTADFAWLEERTVGEFDGRVKYARLLKPGQDAGDAVFEEKLREDAMRAERLSVARWIWKEITCFDAVADRIRRGFQAR